MPTSKRYLCGCGQPCRAKGRSITGLKLYDRVCWRCREGGYRLNKKTYCEACGFVGLHPVQLDVDHIDGNHNNNDTTNLQTLCANCHRLKTQINNDHLPVRGDKPIVKDNQLNLFEVHHV